MSPRACRTPHWARSAPCATGCTPCGNCALSIKPQNLFLYFVFLQPLFAALAWQKRPVFMTDIKEGYPECVCCPRTSDQTSCHHLVRVRCPLFLLVCRRDIWWLWLDTVSWASTTSPVRSSRSFQMVRYLCAMMGVTIVETRCRGPCVATGSSVGRAGSPLSHSVIL